jgi:peptidoglycan-N-acetylglucosamine deacetylase
LTKHTVITLLFALSFFALLGLNWFYPIHPAWFILLLLLYVSILSLGSYFVGLQYFMNSYCKGDVKKPQIAITFDDGPNEDTPKVLEILEKYKVPATFFCIGRNLAGREDVVRSMVSRGHLIGTHSFQHHWSFPLQSPEKIAAEIRLSQETIVHIIGRKPLFFRPPFGVTDPPLAKAVRQTAVYSIGWSLRSYDTVAGSAEKLLAKVKRVRNGDIVLFHEHGLQTNVILADFIEYVWAKGIEIVPLDQLLSGIKAYEN